MTAFSRSEYSRLISEYERLGSASLAGRVCGMSERNARRILAKVRENGVDATLNDTRPDETVRALRQFGGLPPDPDQHGRLILPELPDSVLVIPDLQFPYAHPDWEQFLDAVSQRFRPALVIGIGDEVDSYFLSSYEHDPENMNPSYEYGRALEDCRRLFDMFPSVLALHSNHGRGRVEKARIRGGFLRQHVADYRQFIGAPKGWAFYDEIRLGDVIFHHGDGEKKLTRAFLERDVPDQFGKHYSVVHGHRHESAGRQAEISVGNYDYFAAYTGALINPYAPAFAYTKGRKAKLGCAVIVHGEFKRVRLKLTAAGRWTGEL